MKQGLTKVPYMAIKFLCDYAKKLKVDVLCIDTLNSELKLYGFNGELFKTLRTDFGVAKNMEDLSRVESSFILQYLPSNRLHLTIMTKDLAAIEKELPKEMEAIFVSVFNDDGRYIMTTELVTGNLSVPVICDSMLGETYRRMMSLRGYPMLASNVNLMENVGFMELLETKADFGGGMIKVNEVPIFMTPGLVNVNKGDTVSINIYDIGTMLMIEFMVTKPKKKCIVKIYYLAHDLRHR